MYATLFAVLEKNLLTHRLWFGFSSFALIYRFFAFIGRHLAVIGRHLAFIGRHFDVSLLFDVGCIRLQTTMLSYVTLKTNKML